MIKNGSWVSKLKQQQSNLWRIDQNLNRSENEVSAEKPKSWPMSGTRFPVPVPDRSPVEKRISFQQRKRSYSSRWNVATCWNRKLDFLTSWTSLGELGPTHSFISLIFTHTLTLTHTLSQTHTCTHSISRSLSLSHTHTQAYPFPLCSCCKALLGKSLKLKLWKRLCENANVAALCRFDFLSLPLSLSFPLSLSLSLSLKNRQCLSLFLFSLLILWPALARALSQTFVANMCHIKSAPIFQPLVLNKLRRTEKFSELRKHA